VSIVLDHLVKRYDGHPVVSDVSLEVADGEFFVLLGPSGSGKSTVLRMIAGLAAIDSGRVLLHGRDVTKEPPQRRGVGFVFQHYALFRNMSVAGNIEFALRVRKMGEADRRRRREELLEMVGLAGLGDRYPQQLSGGQQQRVALARALAHNPAVLLLDEPFGALDAVIRSELRRAVRRVQRELRITAIFVTHDQEEAFELADRVGVMSAGRLLEVSLPEELYLRPKTEFAATFLGTANVMVGDASNEGVRIGPVQLPIATEDSGAPRTGRVQVLFRPEDVALGPTQESIHAPLLGQGTVEEIGFAGSFERLRLRLPGLAGVRAISPPAPFGGEGLLVEALRSQHVTRLFPLKRGDSTWVGVRRVHTLTHPGLSFLFVLDDAESAGAALELGSQIARLAHARVTILACGAPEEQLREGLQEVRQSMGAGFAGIETRATPYEASMAVSRETAGRHFDLVVLPRPRRGAVLTAERVLQAGAFNVLVVPSTGPVPKRVLICVAVGEPGKTDVQFAARLVRHLDAEATILTVLADGHTSDEAAMAERFLQAGARSMTLLGVPATTRIRSGDVSEQILEELSASKHELVVVGAPLPNLRGELALGRLIKDIVTRCSDCPVLIVRST
jgi:sulfate transport system ATP-binding protein